MAARAITTSVLWDVRAAHSAAIRHGVKFKLALDVAAAGRVNRCDRDVARPRRRNLEEVDLKQERAVRITPGVNVATTILQLVNRGRVGVSAPFNIPRIHQHAATSFRTRAMIAENQFTIGV